MGRDPVAGEPTGLPLLLPADPFPQPSFPQPSRGSSGPASSPGPASPSSVPGRRLLSWPRPQQAPLPRFSPAPAWVEGPHPGAPGPMLTSDTIHHRACAPLGVRGSALQHPGPQAGLGQHLQGRRTQLPCEALPGACTVQQRRGHEGLAWTSSHAQVPPECSDRAPALGPARHPALGAGGLVSGREGWGLLSGSRGPLLQGEGGGPHGRAGWRPVPVLMWQRQSVPRKKETMQ